MVRTTLLLGREKASRATALLVGGSRWMCARAVLVSYLKPSRLAVQSITGNDAGLSTTPTFTVHRKSYNHTIKVILYITLIVLY